MPAGTAPGSTHQMSLSPDGSLLLRVGGAELRKLPPSAYEMRANQRVPIEIAYVLTNNEISFAVRGRTPGLQMVVDPVLQYATYLGGSKLSDFNNCGASTEGGSVAIDPTGNSYVTGQTTTLDFPVTKGAFLTTGTQQCLQYPEKYVTKFSKSGQLLYSTYLSGDDGRLTMQLTITFWLRGRLRPGGDRSFFRSIARSWKAALHAATGGPNQVVSASASPCWVRSPTQATYPSGRIKTAVGAVTAPSAGSSHVHRICVSIWRRSTERDLPME